MGTRFSANEAKSLLWGIGWAGPCLPAGMQREAGGMWWLLHVSAVCSGKVSFGGNSSIAGDDGCAQRPVLTHLRLPEPGESRAGVPGVPLRPPEQVQNWQ